MLLFPTALDGFEAPLQLVQLPWLHEAGVELAVLRLDLVDPELSGNKWFKLYFHLSAARAVDAKGVLSLGGPHSNHLHALAAAGRRFGMATVGLLRGLEQTTPTIEDLKAFGMQLHWMGYAGYRARHNPDFFDTWRQRYPHYHMIPEGGSGLLGARGCACLVDHVRLQLPKLGWTDYDAWWLAAGTGTTLAGLVIGERGVHPVYGALAGPLTHGVATGVAELLREAGMADGGYRLIEAARNGFGRFDAALAHFICDVERITELPLEPVYTAKAMMALRLFVQAGQFPKGSRIIFLHTGGLQGRRAAQVTLDKLLN